MPKDNISWLSPRRRKTTGNLKSVNGAQTNGVTFDAPASPTIEEEVVARPSAHQRAISQPSVPVTSGDGNLFYAYARKV